jgi:hypothetical protein
MAAIGGDRGHNGVTTISCNPGERGVLTPWVY